MHSPRTLAAREGAFDLRRVSSVMARVASRVNRSLRRAAVFTYELLTGRF
jgi:hypothetical protein